MIEILRQSDLAKVAHYPKSVVDEIRKSVAILDEAYGTDRTRDGDGGLVLIAETEADLFRLIQSLPWGDIPEVAELIDGYVHALYLINNDRGLDIFTPKEWATKSMLEVMEK